MQDPTVQLAVALGLDPLRLQLHGGQGSHGGCPAAGEHGLGCNLLRPVVASMDHGFRVRFHALLTVHRHD